MSLPSIFDYLPDLAGDLVKTAMEQPKHEGPTQSPSVLRAAGKAALVGALGTGVGTGLGYLSGRLLDSASQGATGQKIPLKYLTIGGALLGPAIAGLSAAHDARVMKELERAHQDSQNRPTAGKLSQK